MNRHQQIKLSGQFYLKKKTKNSFLTELVRNRARASQLACLLPIHTVDFSQEQEGHLFHLAPTYTGIFHTLEKT